MTPTTTRSRSRLPAVDEVRRQPPFPLFRKHNPQRAAYADAMGLTRTDITIRNRHGEGDGETLTFLVDSGAYYSVIPSDVLERLGVDRIDRRNIGLADGRSEVMDMGLAELELDAHDRLDVARVLFGPAGSEPLLGVLVLESLNLILDPASQSLLEGPPVWMGNRFRIRYEAIPDGEGDDA